MKTDSFFWYDLETFGLDPRYDRIAQFAGQRTDTDLNPIDKPIILYCRLSADYIPDPASCIVTGITPQEVKSKGIPESEFIEKINNQFSRPGTCVCGFNSIKFDDEFIRNALYRNFIDPYEREWKNGCSRWDIIDLVRACRDFRPDGIVWPVKENGNPSFKLTDLTEANNIDQTGAHDAMVDVNATIAVAKLIKQKQERLFNHFFKLRSKIEVRNILVHRDKITPVLHTSASFTTPDGCTRLIVPISPDVDRDNSIVCFDLSQDANHLISCSAEELQTADGLFNISTNKCPFLAPVATLDSKSYKRLGIDYEKCIKNFGIIKDNIASLIAKTRKRPQPEYQEIDDPDFEIYTKFFSDSDKRRFEAIRETAPENRLSLNYDFDDSRCRQMLWRHVCRNYPNTLDYKNLQEWKSFSASRLLCPPANKINDLFFVQNKINERINDNTIDVKDKQTLAMLKEYIDSLKNYLGIKGN